MSGSDLYADIILPLPLDQDFTYRVPAGLQNEVGTGKRVIVQFGSRRLYTGIIRRIHNEKPDYTDLKSLVSVLDEKTLVNEIQLRFWDWMSDYYMCSPGEVFKSALPSGLKLESESHIIPNNEFDPSILEEARLDILFRIIKSNPGLSIKELTRLSHKEDILPDIRRLIDLDAAILEEKLNDRLKRKTETVIFLNTILHTETGLNKAIDSLIKATKQREALEEIVRLSIDKNGKIIPSDIQFSILLKRHSPATLKTLVSKGFILKREREVNPLKIVISETRPPEKLSHAQNEAFESIRNKFTHKDVVLLHGVTSSGKTEIYIHLIKEIIDKGQQVLYLLPEIALTSQIVNRLRKIFGNQVGIYHSRFSDTERVRVYKQMAGIKDEEYKIILGVRSAIFLPFRKLGLIVVDEEHENTYKQFDPAPRYNARDSAVVLASLHNAKVLLGTATPSIESYANCISGKYEKITLTERFGKIMLPEILVADIRDAKKRKTMRSVFTPVLLDAMENTFKNGKQVILFQNRRGFSSFLECESCGWIPKCKTCDVSLTYHKFTGSLVCHYCGYSRKISDKCDNCNSSGMITRGFGTELVEDEISLIFPGIKVSRLDLDTSRTRNSYEKILEDFGNGMVNVLVGTQMLSKGLDFENVSLVGILNADQMLNYPDFRAFERSFQLMAQVSGRSGRKDTRGKVIIQTSDPENPIIRFVRENDFESMFTEQIHERQIYKYPPFVRMIKVSLRHKNFNQVEKAAHTLAGEMKMAFGKRVFGPQSPLIGRISNNYLMDILLKVEKQSSFEKARNILRGILEKAEKSAGSGSLKIVLDVDPF